MRSRRNLARAALVLLVAVFAFGVLELFQLRFDAGTVYPPYSTFRPDPLGAKAFFDSLELSRGMTAVRNADPFSEIAARTVTIVIMGVASLSGAEERMASDLERFAGAGARVVIAFTPEWPEFETRRRNSATAEPPHEPRPDKSDKEPLLQRVGVKLARLSTKLPNEEAVAVLGGIPRRTALYFNALSPDWTVRRTEQNHPVVIERRWHSGSLVFISDSWPLSNEALSGKPDARELAWLIGPNRTVIFDESHLGIEENGSIAGLIRRYRLHGVVMAMIVLAALFVWSRSAAFLPKPDALDSGSVVAGRSSSAGLIGILERTVPPERLIDVCLDEWQTTPAASAGALREAIDREHGGLRETDPVLAYEHIRNRIEKLTHPWKRASND